MFDERWYKKVFVPMVIAAKKAGVNMASQTRFINYCAKHDCNEMRWFVEENSEMFDDMVGECFE